MAYSTITKPSLHFNTKLYTGNGSTQSITGVNFQPDMVWTKSRGNSNNHNIYDAVRGATKRIYPNSTSAEVTTSNTLTSFDSDGFSLGDQDNVNANGITMASWNWKANGSGSANTDGDINSTVSVNTTAGFSIVKYTGSGSVATIGHGLGVAPKLIIVKRLTGGTEAFPVDCRAASGTLYLNETGSLQSYGNSTPFPSDAPTSTKFYVGSANNANASGSDFIAYCFAEKKGYSKIGKYTGNGSSDGTFVYTGFKPAFFLLKKSSAAGDSWTIIDSKRIGYNPRNDQLYPNSSNTEYASDRIDIVSNGIKINNDDGGINASGATYIYLAFAEEPLVANVGASIPATAR
jgi:hypothetical protein